MDDIHQVYQKPIDQNTFTIIICIFGLMLFAFSIGFVVGWHAKRSEDRISNFLDKHSDLSYPPV